MMGMNEHRAQRTAVIGEAQAPEVSDVAISAQGLHLHIRGG